MSYGSRLSVAVCIGSHALIGTEVGLWRWAGCLEELVAQNAMHVVCAIGQHKREKVLSTSLGGLRKLTPGLHYNSDYGLMLKLWP